MNPCRAKGLNRLADVSDNRCRVAVTIEELFTVCPCTPKYFIVEVRNTSGEVVARGQVAGGSSAVFSLPCSGVYAVTAIGDRNSSPRSQTRRIRCCCGEASGLTFIFTVYEPVCSNPPVPCPPPPCCPPPCPPPCEPPSYPVPLSDNGDSANGSGERSYELTISRCR